ncbi:unnamed protein product [Linum trigynum]|uniref:Uncharacterized protein n=1 Tax=Linum trigynum TaxID=586398 RepID=A0AAV2CQ01_9ROSI
MKIPTMYFAAYQGDFNVIGEHKYLGAFLMDDGEEEGRVMAYQSLENALFRESSDSGGDFYSEEFAFAAVAAVAAVVAIGTTRRWWRKMARLGVWKIIEN